jgi:hypothetical protein
MADNNPVKVSIVDPIQLNVNMPNIKGDAGKDGDSAYLTAVKNGFVGTEREWLESLKAKVDLTKSTKALKRKNIYLETYSIDTVLEKTIELLGDSVNVVPKELTYEQPLAGQRYIQFNGQPHFKVAIDGGEKHEFTTTSLRVEIPSSASNNVRVDYFNLLDEKINSIVVSLVNNAQSEDLGGFVKDIDLSTLKYMSGISELSGTAKVYSKGVVITPSAITLRDVYGARNVISDLLSGVVANDTYDTIKVDLTLLPENTTGYIGSEIKNVYNMLYKSKNFILKVNKNQVVVYPNSPFEQPSTGTANTLTFESIRQIKVKINGSSSVQADHNLVYTFDTDTIE